MTQYDYIVILCPSESNQKGFFDEVSVDKKINISSYLGGQVRMDAAVDIAQNTKKIIVVGGSLKKVSDMKNYLLEELNKRNTEKLKFPKIIRIESDQDTSGNLWAIKKWMNDYKIDLSKKKVGILTNFYHIVRAMRFASDILPENQFIPLVAESLITSSGASFPFYPKEFLFRVHSEINGLRDWENGYYRDQMKRNWKSICHDPE